MFLQVQHFCSLRRYKVAKESNKILGFGSRGRSPDEGFEFEVGRQTGHAPTVAPVGLQCKSARRMRNAPLASTDLADIQQSFADAYPRIQGLASAQHCRLKGEEKEEAVAETIAISWSEYRKLALAGRDVVHVARTFPLDQAAGAHRALAEHYLGKLALRPQRE